MKHLLRLGLFTTLITVTNISIAEDYIVNIGTLGEDRLSRSTYGVDLNDNGFIVGSSFNENGRSYGFIYDGQEMREISLRAANTFHATSGKGDAFAINDNNQVAAYSYDPIKRNYYPVFYDYATDTTTTIGLGGIYRPGLSGHPAMGLNNSGQVYGTSRNASNIDQGYLYDGANNIETTLDSSLKTFTTSINSHGQVIGSTKFGTNRQQAFVYDGNSTYQIGFKCDNGDFVEKNNIPIEITDSKFVLGNGLNKYRRYDNPFIYDINTQTFQQIGFRTDRNAYGVGNDINENGQIVGVSKNHANENQAFVFDYQTQTLTELSLGGTKGEAFAINNIGQVVGESENALGQTQAFLFEGFDTEGNANIVELSLGGDSGSALGINDVGDVYGWSYTNIDLDGDGEIDNERHAFFYTDGEIYDLTLLIEDETNGEFTINNPKSDIIDLNNNGQLLVNAYSTSDKYQAFLINDVRHVTITPIPEPSTYLLMILGLSMLMVTARSRRNKI